MTNCVSWYIRNYRLWTFTMISTIAHDGLLAGTFRNIPGQLWVALDLGRLSWTMDLPIISFYTMGANNYQLFTRPNTSLIPSIIQCFLKLLGLCSVLCWIILFFIVTAIKLNLEWILASSWNTNSSSISTWSFNRINFSIFKLKCISAFY